MDHTLNLQHQDWISTDKGRDIPLCIPESLPPNSSAGAVYHRIDLPLSTDTQVLQLQTSYALTVNQYHAKSVGKTFNSTLTLSIHRNHCQHLIPENMIALAALPTYINT